MEYYNPQQGHKVGCYAGDKFAHLLGDAGQCRCDLYYTPEEFRTEMVAQGYVTVRNIQVRLDGNDNFTRHTLDSWMSGEDYSIGREDRGSDFEIGCEHRWRVWARDSLGFECVGEIRDEADGLVFVAGDFSEQSRHPKK